MSKIPCSIHLLLALALVLGMVVSPVSAAYSVTGNYGSTAGAGYPVVQSNVYNLTFVADAGKALSVVEYDLPINTRVDFIVTYGNANTVSGYMEYYAALPAGWSYSNVSLGSMARSEGFPDVQIFGYSLTRHVQFSSYGLNTSSTPPATGFTLYAQGYGVISDEIVFFPVANMGNNLITKIQIVSTKGITVSISQAWMDSLAETVNKNALQYIADKAGEISADVQKWIDLAWAMAGALWEIVNSAYYWLKFFFWDNLGMTVALYISVTMVFAARASRGDMGKFLRQFIRDQLAFAKGILSLWETIIVIITSFRGIFRI